MKIYINPIFEPAYLQNKISNILNTLNIEIISDIDEEYDNAIMIPVDECVVFSANFKKYNKPSIRFDISDKFILNNLLENNNLPYIPTIMPLTVEDVHEFFNVHGSFIAKPRLGSGGKGRYDFHYKIYYSVDEFLSDIELIPNFWDIQNVTEYRFNKIISLQTIIQKNVLDDNNETTKIRLKGLVNPTYDFNIRLIPEHKVIKNQDIGPGFKRNSSYTATDPNQNCDDHPFVIMVKQFLTNVGFNSSFFDCEAVKIGDDYYINDFSIRFPKGSYCVWDDKPRLESALKFIFGLSETHEYPIDYWTIHHEVIVPCGITEEIYKNLESDNARKYHTISESEKHFTMMIRGDTEQECIDEITRIESYISTLST